MIKESEENRQLREILRAGAKDNFVLFCYYYDYQFFKDRPFLKQIAQAFQQVADGEIKTLSVSLPPRAGKSYITTLFCAWMLGKYPVESVMRNTCTATLARKLSYDAREVVKSEKFSSVFHNVKLSDDKAAIDGWNTNQSKNVGYFGQGVGGTIIGFGASKVAITDDLFRSMEDAMSETIRDKVHSWYEATHLSRKESGCAEIDIGTRWTREDVIGKNMENGRYERSIVVSALDENGKSFCESVMTTQEYQTKRERMVEEIWLAEYQQQPIDLKGRLYENLRTVSQEKKEWIKEHSEGSLMYVDVADEGSDYLCAVVGHVIGADVYITDIAFTKANTDVTIPRISSMIIENNTPYTRIETNAMGGIFMKEIRKLIPPKNKLLGIASSTNKQTRIIMNASFVLNKFVFMDIEKGEYYLAIQNLKSFSKEGKNKNDDCPDAMTGLAMFFQSMFKHL